MKGYEEDLRRHDLDGHWYHYPEKEILRKLENLAEELRITTPFVSEVEIDRKSTLYFYHKVANYRRPWHVPFAVVANNAEEAVVKMEKLFRNNMTLTDPKERLDEMESYVNIIRNLTLPVSSAMLFWKGDVALLGDD